MKVKITGTPEMKKGGQWMQKAANSIKKRGTKGKCTPMSKPSCTGRARALAKTFKKIARKRKKHELGGLVQFKTGGLINHGVGDYNPHWFGQDTVVLNPDTDPRITHTVKPVDEEDATIEAEIGEVIVKPGLAGIYKIGGKKHSQGGTPLAPEPGSFIFSNDSKLAIPQKTKKLFEFKEGGSTAKSKNTPADILKREIDIKEYNRHVSILQDPKADPIAKATAKLMIAKYQRKIGQLAYLQEAKKHEVIPEFAQGTAPVKNGELDQAEQEQEMYKRGGMYRADLGMDIPCPCGKDANGNCLPCDDTIYQNILKSRAKKVEVPPSDYQQLYDTQDATLYGKFGKDGKLITGPKMSNDAWAQFLKNESPAHKQARLAKQFSTPDDYVYTPKFQPSFVPEVKPEVGPPVEDVPPAAPVPPAPAAPAPPFNAIPSLGYNVKGYLTPAQKANLSYLGLQAMGIKKYIPMREQTNVENVRFDTQNAQPYLNNIQNQQFQAYNSNNAVDPRTAKLVNSNIFGKGLDASNNAISQVFGQNIQTANAQNQFNVGQQNQNAVRNAGLSHQYYDQTIAADQNFDNERRFARNQVMSTMNQYQSQDDALAWQLASTYKYGNRLVRDPKTGKVSNQPVPIMEYTPNGIRYNADVADIRNATGSGRVDDIAKIKKFLDSYGIDPLKNYKSAFALSALVKAFGNAKNPIDYQ